MSHQHGAYLGGIRTLADLRKRCAIDGDCWLWGGGLSNGRPSVNLMGPTGKRSAQTGRRVAAVLAGALLKPGDVVWQSPKCSEALCVNPAHAEIGARSAALLEHERRDGWSKRSHRSRAGARLVALVAKVTAEQAAEIRESTAPRREIAAKYGICLSQVHNIRNGTCWRGPAAAVNSSVFSWKGQA